ncbi:esterase [Nibricoccus aquaticus]|uniref:Esterase n=1 Tax=Nibricoccus aquaticus TaxID=2576891 RepID=A0A290Q9T2_9BACT|nr:alpha/beta hydrolase [Nibricoccus aquaticus]ATC65409.1 esterase [Nibricoccus aquaticus]
MKNHPYKAAGFAAPKLLFFITVCSVFNVGGGRLSAQVPQPATAASDAPSVRQIRDLVYQPASDGDMKLDLYLPAGDTKGPVPLVIWLHGGGWREGGRGFCPISPFAREGYAVASVSYRFTNRATFPAQIEDCKAAVRWLRAHANEYGYDPQRIGVCGESAGATLAALLGTAPVIAEWGDGEGATSSAVRAVVALCPPTDFTLDDPEQDDVPGLLKSADPKQVAFGKMIRSRRTVLEAALGGPLAERRELARIMSPRAHVTSDDPSFLLVHGDNDRLVPLSQSVLLMESLQRANVGVELVVVAGAGHGFGRPKPELMARIKKFFDERL